MTLQTIKASVLKFMKDEDGLTVVEYAIAGGLISLAVIGGFQLLGADVSRIINGIATALT